MTTHSRIGKKFNIVLMVRVSRRSRKFDTIEEPKKVERRRNSLNLNIKW